MPADLLRGVPGDSPTARRWWLLPLSIVAHVFAVGAAIVIPLAADTDAPPIHPARAQYIAVAAMEPPAPPLPKGTARSAPAAAVPPREAPLLLPRPADIPSPLATSDLPAIAGAPGPGVENGVVPDVAANLGGAPVRPPEVVTPAAPRQPVRVGQGINAPRKVTHVDPVYPQVARGAGISGTVMLEAVINERGVVERVKVLKSVPLLDAAAVDAVIRWRYTPTTLNNVAVPVLMTITVTFKLR